MLRYSKESPKSLSRLTSYLLKKLLIQSFRSESHNGSGTSVFLLICLIQHSKELFTVRFVKRQETLELENFHTTKSFSLFHCFIHCSALLCFRFFLGCWMGFEMTTEAGSCFELKFIANGSVDFLLLFRQDFFFCHVDPIGSDNGGACAALTSSGDCWTCGVGRSYCVRHARSAQQQNKQQQVHYK